MLIVSSDMLERAPTPTRPPPASAVAVDPIGDPTARAPFGVAGLFAGIGGIELGLRRAGHESRLLCELDPGASAVLADRFPGVELHGDVRSLLTLARDVELLTAGFPCQDLSQAGRTAGIAGARSGLVHEVFRLLEKCKVPWLLLENVPFMLQLARGEALGVIIDELERLGYRWAYRVVNSQAFGLPQRRLRVFLVAALTGDPRTVLFADEAGPPLPLDSSQKRACGFYWTEGIRGLGWAEDGIPTLKGGSTIGIPSPPAIVLQTGQIVKPDIRDAERMQGFEADWTLPALQAARRGHRWKLVGNAVSVDVAHWIGRRLRQPGALAVPMGERLDIGSTWPKAACNVGAGRHRVLASEWPVRIRGVALHQFLQYEPEPLSIRATAGFLRRTDVSSLHFPDGFLATVREHLATMERHALANSPKTRPRPSAAL
jgi:DNA (cytosine-5)-methyltransferase 1